MILARIGGDPHAFWRSLNCIAIVIVCPIVIWAFYYAIFLALALLLWPINAIYAAFCALTGRLNKD